MHDDLEDSLNEEIDAFQQEAIIWDYAMKWNPELQQASNDLLVERLQRIHYAWQNNSLPTFVSSDPAYDDLK